MFSGNTPQLVKAEGDRYRVTSLFDKDIHGDIDLTVFMDLAMRNRLSKPEKARCKITSKSHSIEHVELPIYNISKSGVAFQTPDTFPQLHVGDEVHCELEFGKKTITNKAVVVRLEEHFFAIAFLENLRSMNKILEKNYRSDIAGSLMFPMIRIPHVNNDEYLWLFAPDQDGLELYCEFQDNQLHSFKICAWGNYFELKEGKLKKAAKLVSKLEGKKLKVSFEKYEDETEKQHGIEMALSLIEKMIKAPSLVRKTMTEWLQKI